MNWDVEREVANHLGGDMRNQIQLSICLGLLLIFMGLDLFAKNKEERCAELGNGCILSEPMNTNQYNYFDRSINQNVNQCLNTHTIIDFGDTEGAGTKEATIPYIRCDRQFPVSTQNSDVGLPTGNDQVNYVMRVDPDSINHMVTYGNHIPAGLNRICMRVYRKFSQNYKGFDFCGANKQQEFWSSNGTAIQLSDGGTNTGTIELWAGAMTNTPASNELDQVGRITYHDCKNNWCRQEICISSEEDIKNFKGIYLEGYTTQVGVENPIRADYQRTYVGEHKNGGGLAELWVTTGYRERCASNTAAEAGYHYVSHGMAAGWSNWNPSMEAQYIGVATEIEGGAPTLMKLSRPAMPVIQE
jgi:hypothetical protein